MATSGPNYPSTRSTSASLPYDDNDFVSIANIGADDTAYASITDNTYDTNDYSYLAKAQGFGFSIDTGATITGVLVETGSYATGTNRAGWMMFQLLNASGAAFGDNKAATEVILPATAITNQTWGGTGDMWGLNSSTLTPAIVNDADFGVQFAIQQNTDNADIYVDYVRITIYYDPAGFTGTGALQTGAAQLSGSGRVIGDYPFFVAATDAQNALTSITFNKPTGTIEGDLLLALVYHYNDVQEPTITPPSGWASIATELYTGGGGYRKWTLLWKRAGASEGADYTFTQTAGGTVYSMKGGIAAFANVTEDDPPYDQYSNYTYNTSNLTIIASSITPTTSPSLGVFISSGANLLTVSSINNSFTEQYDQTASEFHLYVGTKDLSGTGAVGETTQTATGTASSNKHAFLINLKPPSINRTGTGALQTAVTALGQPTTTYSQEITASSPLAWWRLDETTGDAVDEISSKVAAWGAYISHGAPSLLPKDSNAAATGSGGSSLISCPNENSPPNPGTAISIEFWQRAPNDATALSTIISKFESSHGWIIRRYDEPGGAGRADIRVDTSGGTNQLPLISGNIFDGLSHHLVWGLEAGTDACKLYVDGILVDTGTITIGSGFANTSALEIVNGKLGASYDEVAIYDRVLTAAEVAAHYAAGVGQGRVRCSGSGALTTGAAQLAGAGTRRLVATGALTSAAAQLAGTSTVTVSGTGALTTSRAQLAGTSEVEVEGQGALTVGAAQLAGAGAVKISGTGALTAAAAQLSGAGTRRLLATGALTTATAQLSGSGSVKVSGTGALTVAVTQLAGAGSIGGTIGTGALTTSRAQLAGTGTYKYSGTGALTPGSAQLAGAGAVKVSGTGALTAGAARVSGTGTRYLLATGALTTSRAQLAGAGAVKVSGTGALRTGAATLSGAGTVKVSGSGALTTGTASLSGAGACGAFIGGGALTTGVAQLAGAGSVKIAGTGALTPASATLAGTGATLEDIAGTGALTAGPTVLSGQGTIRITATGALTTAPAALQGSGAIAAYSGTGYLESPRPQLAGQGAIYITGSGTLLVASPTLAGAGVTGVNRTGSGDLTTAFVTLDGSGWVEQVGYIALDPERTTSELLLVDLEPELLVG